MRGGGCGAVTVRSRVWALLPALGVLFGVAMVVVSFGNARSVEPIADRQTKIERELEQLQAEHEALQDWVIREFTPWVEQEVRDPKPGTPPPPPPSVAAPPATPPPEPPAPSPAPSVSPSPDPPDTPSPTCLPVVDICTPIVPTERGMA